MQEPIYIKEIIYFIMDRKKINIGGLTSIINESISEVMAEQKLKETVRRIVNESLEELGGFQTLEGTDDAEQEKKQERHNDSIEKKDERLSDMNTETEKESEKRSQIENFFKDKGVNNAPYAYELFGVSADKGKDTNAMKNARSEFAKKLNHELNDNGYPYSFSSSEVNRLESLRSGGQLAEAVEKAIKKVLGNF